MYHGFPAAVFGLLVLSVPLLASDPLLIPELPLSFDKTQVHSGKFALLPKTASDPDVLKTYHGEGEEYLRVIERDSVDSRAADDFFKAKILQLKMMFTPYVTPYSGAITVDSQCLSRTKLQEKIRDEGRQRSVVFLLGATENFVYGTCVKENEKYTSQFLLLYCMKEKKFYELKFFTTREHSLSDKPIAHCQ